MIDLFVLLLVGCVIVTVAIFALLRMSNRDTGSLQVVEIQLANLMELRALSFKNFPSLFSDCDCRVLGAEPRLVGIAKRLRAERRRLALRWLASVRSDVLALWLLRRLLIAYGVSLGPVSE